MAARLIAILKGMKISRIQLITLLGTDADIVDSWANNIIRPDRGAQAKIARLEELVREQEMMAPFANLSESEEG